LAWAATQSGRAPARLGKPCPRFSATPGRRRAFWQARRGRGTFRGHHGRTAIRGMGSAEPTWVERVRHGLRAGGGTPLNSRPCGAPEGAARLRHLHASRGSHGGPQGRLQTVGTSGGCGIWQPANWALDLIGVRGMGGARRVGTWGANIRKKKKNYKNERADLAPEKKLRRAGKKAFLRPWRRMADLYPPRNSNPSPTPRLEARGSPRTFAHPRRDWSRCVKHSHQGPPSPPALRTSVKRRGCGCSKRGPARPRLAPSSSRYGCPGKCIPQQRT